MEEEAAKAAQEISKFGTKAIESGEKLGSFLARVFGTLPEDVVGVVGGDWLHHIRIRNVVRLAQRTEEILKERGISDRTQPLSPSIAIPLLHAAQDETRDELRELWARMLANGMDPKKSGAVRQSVIATVRVLDPLDAVVLERAYQLPLYQEKWRTVINLPKELDVSRDEFEVTIKNLKDLGCIEIGSAKSEDGIPATEHIALTHFAREILRACSL